ncbi:HNH endonuclease [Ferrimonas sp. SCSIO 43195]|nr:HNH endonuclease [Ferrimonas sp. SCSIO 43195]
MDNMDVKHCLREPIPEIFDAARYLDAAVSAHLSGHQELAEELLRLSDMDVLREWTESLWGANSPYVQRREIPGAPAHLPQELRVPVRMPNTAERDALHKRDGFHCRFCGTPLIRKEVRQILNRCYPEAARWGTRNIEQHAALQLMWLQYDHLVPHARGGNNDLSNLVLTCAPCNYGRLDSLVEEVGLISPFSREPNPTDWDGLERLLR